MIARHHERHRESPQPNAPCAAPCETLARRDDGAALGGRRGARSGEGGPPGARMSRYARAGRCPPGTRRAVRTRGVVRDGCVVVNQAAAEFQQRTGHPPVSVHLAPRAGRGSSCPPNRTPASPLPGCTSLARRYSYAPISKESSATRCHVPSGSSTSFTLSISIARLISILLTRRT